MNIHQKINLKDNPLCYLEFKQYLQLVERNRLALAPYYKERLKRQENYLLERDRIPEWVKELEEH